MATWIISCLNRLHRKGTIYTIHSQTMREERIQMLSTGYENDIFPSLASRPPK
jgi:hypothetical protein